MKILTVVIFSLCSCLLLNAQDTYQVVTIRQHETGMALEVRINMSGGSMEFKKVHSAQTFGNQESFSNVKDVLDYLDRYGYSLENVTVLREIDATITEEGISRSEKGVWQVVQYIFRLRSDKGYPILKI